MYICRRYQKFIATDYLICKTCEFTFHPGCLEYYLQRKTRNTCCADIQRDDIFSTTKLTSQSHTTQATRRATRASVFDSTRDLEEVSRSEIAQVEDSPTVNITAREVLTSPFDRSFYPLLQPTEITNKMTTPPENWDALSTSQ